jgi:hypothetical protein
MAVWICKGCTAAYSVGAPRCPECSSTEYADEEEQNMPKITVAGGRPGRGGRRGVIPFEQLIAIRDEAIQRARDEQFRQLEACPNDGEPWRTGADGLLFCPFDGYRPDGTYVRDQL